jgi:hypothetical protein
VLDAQILAELAFATNSLDPAIFGLAIDQAIELLAAHYLSLAPGAQQARLDPSAAKDAGTNTTYGRMYLTIRDRAVACRRIF